MIDKNGFHIVYSNLSIKDKPYEEILYVIFNKIHDHLIARSNNDPRLIYDVDTIFQYFIEEFLFMTASRSEERILELLNDEKFVNQYVSIVSDKYYINELNPYHPISLINNESPILSTLELINNFILNRVEFLKNNLIKKDVLLDMFSKVFYMFKSISYLLSNGFETEAFSTWRTIHELECVIKIINDNRYVIPTYLRHIVYNSAFRDMFDDKEEQQKAIDELKMHMKAKNLKSKDMKKYIEYGWLYSIKSVEESTDFKLNFRAGLEKVAGLSMYSDDYEMSSEVAHSSPLLIYSNKKFFKSLTVVRIYESFLRLENIFYENLKLIQDPNLKIYENMRNSYIPSAIQILNREITELNQLTKK